MIVNTLRVSLRMFFKSSMGLTRIFALFMAVTPCLSWAIDLQPNDVVAPPPDKTYAMISYFGTKNTTFYRNGNTVSSRAFQNPVIENNSAILRVARSYNFFGLPAVSFFQMPYTQIAPSGSLSSMSGKSGFGDLTLATAVWPYANRESRTYLGVAGYVTLPVGSYENDRVLNLSENRYRFDLQIGFQKPIVGNLDGMIAVDTRWFSANNSCAAACSSLTNVTLSQKPVTTLQIGPIYKINETFTVGASYFYVSGGATTINGVTQDNPIRTQRFLLSLLAYTKIGRFSVQYGRDMETENGFTQNRLLALRYMRSF